MTKTILSFLPRCKLSSLLFWRNLDLEEGVNTKLWLEFSFFFVYSTFYMSSILDNSLRIWYQIPTHLSVHQSDYITTTNEFLNLFSYLAVEVGNNLPLWKLHAWVYLDKGELLERYCNNIYN